MCRNGSNVITCIKCGTASSFLTKGICITCTKRAEHKLNKNFDVVAYWEEIKEKKWVVLLSSPKDKDVKHVTATTMQGAIVTAKTYTFLKGGLIAKARLATPSDLGCVQFSHH